MYIYLYINVFCIFLSGYDQKCVTSTLNLDIKLNTNRTFEDL